jgi:transcriptional regulator with XRE-family HTH domain
MFELNGLSQRLQSLRKSKKWTQEELADFLNVSGQAVSKWETGQSYPDITIMPTIASLYGVDMDYLFGKTRGAQLETVPPSYENLPLAHNYEGMACYSSKEVKAAEGPAVTFTDGSTAELAGRLIINKGPGEIRLINLNDKRFASANLELSKKEFTFFESPESIYVEVLNNECKIVRSADTSCHVYAEGDGDFLEKLNVSEADSVLSVTFQNQGGNNNRHSDNNSVRIELPNHAGKACAIKINGSGSAEADGFCFEMGELHINGSGDIKAGDFGTVNGSINGSGDIEWRLSGKTSAHINGSGDIKAGEAQSLTASINGSGDISVSKLSGQSPLELKINGSGDITINEGQCAYFKAEIFGSGDIDAAGVTAQDFEIVIHNSGSVSVGRVVGVSREQIKQDGSIKIIKRG